MAGLRSRKPLHRGMALGVDTYPGQHFPGCQQQDARINPGRPVIDVPYVKGEFTLPRNRIPAVDLGPAGHSGYDVVSPGLLGSVEFEVLCK